MVTTTKNTNLMLN